MQADPTPFPSSISPQMVRALGALARGKSRQQIAMEMGISQSTLRTYLWKVYRRLDAQNAAEAVAKALERGLIR